jgi:hypothetical protein
MGKTVGSGPNGAVIQPNAQLVQPVTAATLTPTPIPPPVSLPVPLPQPDIVELLNLPIGTTSEYYNDSRLVRVPQDAAKQAKTSILDAVRNRQRATGWVEQSQINGVQPAPHGPSADSIQATTTAPIDNSTLQ